MTKLTRTMMLTAMTSAALWAAPSFAQMGAGNEGSGEAPRGASIEGIGGAAPIVVPKVEEGASRAAPMLDEEKAVKSFSVMTKSRDGKETRSDPSEALKSIIIKSLNAPAEKKAEGSSAPQSGKDPVLTEGEEANRQVFGSDDRVQIKNTKVYPYTTIGYIQGKTKGGTGSCSGTLIGPRTVLTAAHCLYNHDDKDFLSDVVYVPSLNGSTQEDAPFGAYAAESVSVVEGFITNYQGTYDSVVPWDLGLITLVDPIGDNLGWLAASNYDDLGDFEANIVGYPGDKPGGTMWRATCPVLVESIGPEIFTYDCDTFPGSSGSSVYMYEASSKQRIITGVNIAESATVNLALRMTGTYIEWINGLWK